MKLGLHEQFEIATKLRKSDCDIPVCIVKGIQIKRDFKR